MNKVSRMGIEEKMVEIINNLFHINVEEESRDISFFEEPYNISARNFLLLFLEIEKIFQIRFSDIAIEEMKIITFNNIVKEIYKIKQEACDNVD